MGDKFLTSILSGRLPQQDAQFNHSKRTKHIRERGRARERCAPVLDESWQAKMARSLTTRKKGG